MSTERRRRRPSRREEVEREYSFGGVAVRGSDVCVIQPRNRRTLALPKGGAAPGEGGPATAAREVREETGLTVEVREDLGVVEYWYRRGGKRIFKTVRFYLCEYVSGDTADHDHEVDDARWMPLDAARKQLSFPGEREIVERAIAALNG
jgi:8-oxo-dGTP pyrophosphatase MutT (NUDIX family)